jgi:hypothetical protein
MRGRKTGNRHLPSGMAPSFRVWIPSVALGAALLQIGVALSNSLAIPILTTTMAPTLYLAFRVLRASGAFRALEGARVEHAGVFSGAVGEAPTTKGPLALSHKDVCCWEMGSSPHQHSTTDPKNALRDAAARVARTELGRGRDSEWAPFWQAGGSSGEKANAEGVSPPPPTGSSTEIGWLPNATSVCGLGAVSARPWELGRNRQRPGTRLRRRSVLPRPANTGQPVIRRGQSAQ